MFQALLICFREGLEAFLVVAIAALYLRRANLVDLQKAVRAGLISAVLTSAVLGVVLAQIGALSSVYAGVLALLAMAAVIWCVKHMMHAGKGMGQEIARILAEASQRNGRKAWWAVFVFTFLMVGREGVETATMIASLASSAEARHMAVGGSIGLAMAALIGWMWVKHGHKVQLSRFFRVTTWFMMVFAVQLLIYALHEFTEAGIIPLIDNAWWHMATEDIAEGWIAQTLAIAMVVVPTVWLIAAYWRDRQVVVKA